MLLLQSVGARGMPTLDEPVLMDSIQIKSAQHFGLSDLVISQHEFFQFFAQHHLHLPVFRAGPLQLPKENLIGFDQCLQIMAQFLKLILIFSLLQLFLSDSGLVLMVFLL